MQTKFIYDDGGREAAGYKGHAGDCVCRSIAIATGLPYKQVYDDLFDAGRNFKGYGRVAKNIRRDPSPRNGVNRAVYQRYLESLGWKWHACTKIGTGTTVHVRADELPAGRLILRLSRHMCAFIDGVIHDTYDPSRDGTRAVYGYFYKP